MRLLSDQEKDLCIRILEGHGGYNCIQNIIDRDLKGILISLDRSLKTVQIEFPVSRIDLTTDETNTIIGRINEISVLILVIVNLINMLEKEGYVMVYQSASKVDNQSRFGQGIGNSPHYVTYDLGDKRMQELLLKLSSEDILVTPEFVRFCNNGFIGRDEQRFNKQIRIAYIALGVALFAAFVNLGFNLYNSFRNKKNERNIEYTQPSTSKTETKTKSDSIR